MCVSMWEIDFSEPRIQISLLVLQKRPPRPIGTVLIALHYFRCINCPDEADQEGALFVNGWEPRNVLCELRRHSPERQYEQDCAQEDSMFLHGGFSFLLLGGRMLTF